MALTEPIAVCGCFGCFAGLRRSFHLLSAPSLGAAREQATASEVSRLPTDKATIVAAAPGTAGDFVAGVGPTASCSSSSKLAPCGGDSDVVAEQEDGVAERDCIIAVKLPGEQESENGDGRTRPLKPPALRRLAEPQGFRRFSVPQKSVYARALREIAAGEKQSCWMWYMIPTPPYMVNGVEKGSDRNRKFALRSDEEVREYLRFKADGVDLRSNYLGIMVAISNKLREGVKPRKLLGIIDEPKLRSSVKLFERVTRHGADKELHGVLEELLRQLKETPEPDN